MVTFKCKQSGNTVSFHNPQDIESMRKEVNYEEVKNGKEQIEESRRNDDDSHDHEERKDERKDGERKDEERQKEVLKKRGRPSKK